MARRGDRGRFERKPRAAPGDSKVIALDLHKQIVALEIEARADKHARLVLADLHEDLGKPLVAESWRRDDVCRLRFGELPEKSFRTRKRVDRMTDAEAEQMAGWAEKWIKIGLSTERADRPLFE